MIGSIPRGPGGDAAFVVQLAHSLCKRQQCVCRRREAKLAIALQAAPLSGEIQTNGARHALSTLQQFTFAQRETKPGHALHAFVGTRHKAVELAAGEVKFDATEGTH